MYWILFVVLQFVVIVAGIQREQRAGLWSWSKFLFAIAFAGLEVALLLIPLNTIAWNSRFFAPVMTAAGIIAALNFIWFIIACRRWRLPDGRTSLEAWREVNHPEKYPPKKPL